MREVQLRGSSWDLLIVTLVQPGLCKLKLHFCMPIKLNNLFGRVLSLNLRRCRHEQIKFKLCLMHFTPTLSTSSTSVVSDVTTVIDIECTSQARLILTFLFSLQNFVTFLFPYLPLTRFTRASQTHLIQHLIRNNLSVMTSGGRQNAQAGPK